MNKIKLLSVLTLSTKSQFLIGKVEQTGLNDVYVLNDLTEGAQFLIGKVLRKRD